MSEALNTSSLHNDESALVTRSDRSFGPHMRPVVAMPPATIRADAFVDVLAQLMQDCVMVFPCLAGS